MAGYESFTDIATDKGVEDPNLSSGKVYSFIYPIYLFICLSIWRCLNLFVYVSGTKLLVPLLR